MNTILYLNGELMHAHDAHISPFDAGFQFGAGLFETILCIDGRPHALRRHVSRLRASSIATRIPVQESDEEIGTAIAQVLEKNSYTKGETRLKLLVTPGDISAYQPVRRSTLLITAEPYLRPAPGMPWRLGLDGRRQAGPILEHKSSSYFGFRLALHAARESGFDDMIILDREGCVAETSIAALLLYHGGHWIIPESQDALPSITRSILTGILEAEGLQILTRPVTAEGLHDSAMLICNSLLGPFPVHSINHTPLHQIPEETVVRLRSAWLEAGYTEPLGGTR